MSYEIRLSYLRIFVTLVKERSFSSTGKKLKITQSSVTQIVKKLENKLNTKLINRSSKYFTLTPTGKLLFNAASEILKIFEDCKADILKHDKEEQNKLKIAVSTTPGEFILPPFFSEFSTRYAPDLRLIIEMGDSKKALELLESGSVHVAIVGSLLNNISEDHEKIPLLKEDLVVIASKNVQTSEHDVLSLESLRKMTRVDRESGSGTQHEADKFLNIINSKLKEKYPDHEQKVIQLQSVQAILSAVSESNDLWSLVGYYPAKKFADLGLIKIVKINDLNLNMSRIIYLVYNKHAVNENMIKFIEHVKKYYEMQSIFSEFGDYS
ncbi:MAG: LysR substrate-binding domain-containing protein [Promethearchaeota archaeon]